MAFEVRMPKLSSTMSEGEITMWLKAEGDTVEVGEPIFEVMTDKIAIEVEAYEEGTLLKKYIGDGERAPVNTIIAYIGKPGETVAATIDEANASIVQTASNIDDSIAENDLNITEIPLASEEQERKLTDKKVRATPSARRIARKFAVNLQTIEGSGPHGRIHASDVKNSLEAQIKKNDNSIVQVDVDEVIPWRGLRKVIADRMVASKTSIPHVTMQAEVDISALLKVRELLLSIVEEQSGQRITITDMIVKAVSNALKDFPQFNAHALDDGIHLKKEVHIGLAVATNTGLFVPVIKHANQLGLTEINRQAKELAVKAREGNLGASELAGSTFTISSLGATKVQNFTPIINVPEVAILGVGGMFEKWDMVQSDEQPEFVKKSILPLSLSFDHRVVDGAPAAEFLSRIVTYLEEPARMLL